jgi:hypothetical protein
VDIERRWDLEMGPLVLRRGYDLWRWADQRNGREQELAYAYSEFYRFNLMRNRFAEALVNDDWSTEAALKEQCEVLEQAVYQSEEFGHYLDILERDTPPPQPTRFNAKRDKARWAKSLFAIEDDEDGDDYEDDHGDESDEEDEGDWDNKDPNDGDYQEGGEKDDDDAMISPSSQPGSRPEIAETDNSFTRNSTMDSSVLPANTGSLMEVDDQAMDGAIDGEKPI